MKVEHIQNIQEQQLINLLFQRSEETITKHTSKLNVKPMINCVIGEPAMILNAAAMKEKNPKP